MHEHLFGACACLGEASTHGAYLITEISFQRRTENKRQAETTQTQQMNVRAQNL